MAVKIGSLLIEVASGVARVESDMKKISKILDANTSAWKKMFDGLKVVASGWVAREVFMGSARAMEEFARAGIEGAAKLQEHASAAAEFKQRQAELSGELKKFAGEVVGPLLPDLNNMLLAFKGNAIAAQYAVHAIRASNHEAMRMAEWLPLVGQAARAWNTISDAVRDYAGVVRGMENSQRVLAQEAATRAAAQKKQDDEDAAREEGVVLRRLRNLALARKAVDDHNAKLAEAEKKAAAERDKWDREQRLKRGREIVADLVAQDRMRDAVERENELRRQSYAEQQALERGRLADELRAQTDAGRRQLIEEEALRELSMADWTERERIAIIKRYGKQERALTAQRYAAQMSIATSGLGAVSDLLSATLGENHKVAKSFAIAEALVNTYAGVTQALRFYPPPQSWIMAASSLAMGIKQVQAIKSTSPSGGGGAASIGGGAPSSQGAVPVETPKAEQAKPRGPELFAEYHFHGPIVGTEAFVNETMIPLLRKATRNRVVIG